jgi:Xaa-Pro aminopeptidase
LWTGARPSLDDVSAWLNLPAEDLSQWPHAKSKLGPCATIRTEGKSADTEPKDAASESDDQRLARVISEARLVKDEWEIQEIREAISATHRGFNDILQALPDALANARGERIVEGVFHTRARLEGNYTGYGTIAASGPHACILHWVDNDGPVQLGDVLLVDAGVERESLYTADITRTIPVSGRFSPLQREVYEAVLAAADHAFSVVKPGAIFRDIHQAAMEIIAARVASWGFLPVSLEESLAIEGQHHRRYMIHGTSHHLGLDVHDCAQARREMYLEKELEPGMVFTIEPGLYFQPDDTTVPPEWRGIGVRIEDNILVRENGAENLSAGIPRTADEVENWVQSAHSPVD